ncbi:pentatricopeptide repeat-containing protein MRL1, chloroplastic isoform X2 [Rhodamnia argentea]|uniref:Pentatricopeptide repeat-containing protein MRL1, chloroplastic isoform X2 n=1 Tax=Rhodamnia argentea TaxID=178133 RepID=A0A8B8NLJ5_9MYRT|nr:pentatricopeptide repeat-containing protein MRL1, chloroplastic isoform X2 [Rhodamnia argentea]
MEASFTTKPQTLILTPCASPSHCLSPAKLSFIRARFLGSSHNLRPPGSIRSRKRCLRLLRFRSHPFVVRASGTSHAVVVVIAVLTVSAVSFFFFHHYARKKSDKRVTGERYIGGEKCGKIEGLPQEKLEERFILEEEQQLNSTESTLASEEIPETSLKSPPSKIFSSNGNVVFSSERKFEDCSHSAVLPESKALQPLILAGGFVELLSQEDKMDEHGDAELPELVVDSLVTAPNHGCDVHEAVEQNDQIESREHEPTSYKSFFMDSARMELYTFYEPRQSEMGKQSSLNLPGRPAASQGTVLDVNGLSSLSRHMISREEKLSLQDSIITTDAEGTVPFSCYNGASSGKRKGIVDDRELSRSKEVKNFQPNKSMELPALPHLNGMHVNKRRHLPKHLSSYNHLLKQGSITDCVHLLEDMEKLGTLDMDKIYHARFYDVCKGRKAVDEAFRFTKLISNPTLSTFNMLMSVCANSLDSEGAFRVLQLVEEAGLKADCKLYTTLISTCAKCGKVDRMFEVFHEMVNSGIEPNVHTYGALIDGCAKAGQVAKAFGAYGILRSKNVKPDRVVFNALITACGQAGAVDRAFDVLAEMRTETHPIDPDHITVGALIKACSNAGQVDRVKEVYKMMDEYKIMGTPDVYTIAINSCSQTGDWEFALDVYSDMKKKGVVPDEIFLSALIDVAGHAGRVDAAFDVLEEARACGMRLGIVSYSSLMGACCNGKSWGKALELYEDMKSIRIKPTISTMNALITALCEGDQLPKAMEIFYDMKRLGLCPNTITYSILLVASERKDDTEIGIVLFSQAKKDGVAPNITMCRCMIGMCRRRYVKACTLGENVLSLNSGWPQVDNRWTSMALAVYRESISAGLIPTIEVVSEVLGCLQLPFDVSLKSKIIENLGVSADTSKYSNLCSLVEGFAEYDPRAFSLLEEAASLEVVPCVSFKQSPLVVDVKTLQIHTAEVYILTVLKGLKYRLAAGAKLPNLTILLPVEKAQMEASRGVKTLHVAGRLSQAVAALLRRLGLPYQGNESYGKVRVSGLALRRWLRPKLSSPFSGKPGEFGLSQLWLGSGIKHQRRNIRTEDLSLE